MCTAWNRGSERFFKRTKLRYPVLSGPVKWANTHAPERTHWLHVCYTMKRNNFASLLTPHYYKLFYKLFDKTLKTCLFVQNLFLWDKWSFFTLSSLIKTYCFSTGCILHLLKTLVISVIITVFCFLILESQTFNTYLIRSWLISPQFVSFQLSSPR